MSDICVAAGPWKPQCLLWFLTTAAVRLPCSISKANCQEIKAVLFMLAFSATPVLHCTQRFELSSASSFQSVMHSISRSAAGSCKEPCCCSHSAPTQLLLYLLSYSGLFLMLGKGTFSKLRNITYADADCTKAKLCLCRAPVSCQVMGVAVRYWVNLFTIPV